MKKCLGCGRYFKEEDLTDTARLMGDGWESDLSGYYCADCLEGKEVCSYCGVPTDDIVFREEDFEGKSLVYCEECMLEISDNTRGDYYKDKDGNWRKEDEDDEEVIW